MEVSSYRRLAALIGVAVVVALGLTGRAQAATINISTTAQLQNTFSAACNTSIGPCAHNGDTVMLAGSKTAYTPNATIDIAVSVTLAGPTTTPGATLSGASVVPDATGDDDLVDTESTATVAIQNLTLTGAAADGAALVADGPLTVSNSTVAGNLGDGIWVAGGATITNSTIAANGTNPALDPIGGVGVLVGAATTFQNDTISGNGNHGVGNVVLGGSPAALDNTIVYGNGTVSRGADCAMPAVSSDQSLDGDHSCGVAFTVNPGLGPLAANGGPTQTEAIPGSSSAVNGGDNAGCPTVDQRYVARNDGACDIGAYEYVDTAHPTLSLPPIVTASAPSPSGTTVDYSSLVTAADPDGDAMTIVCTPPTGSLFPLGTTTVSCTATDTHANKVVGSFPVTVTSGTGGVSCRADGKITGRGGLMAAKALAVFDAGFQQDVCGAVGDSTGTTMSIFDYDALTGSAIGLETASCRGDAFAASDVPYTTAQLTQLDGAPGAAGCSDLYATMAPYAPGAGHAWTYPAAADTAGTLMTIPLGGTAIAFGIELQASDCGGTKPGPIQLSVSMISRLMSGDIKSWDDPALRAGGLNAALANCHTAVTRVVRADSSQTTQNLKNYFVHADNNRSTATACYLGGHWQAYANPVFNTTWPGGGSVCSPVAYPSAAGDGPQLSLCASTHGAICYADLPDLVGQTTLIRPSIRNATDTTYAAPSTGFAANCSFAALLPPSGGSAGAIGMNTGDTWATDNASGDHGDVTDTGTGYPICELTFLLAYSGLENGGTAVSALNYDQRRTLASYLVYILSEPAQYRLSSSYFQQLPAAIVATLRSGVQANA
jgi:hypothetical protein